MLSRVVFSSKSYNWDSPDDLIKDLDGEFHFNFDPANPPRFGNFNGNALKDDWKVIEPDEKPDGTILGELVSTVGFLNHPYGRTSNYLWALKVFEQMQKDYMELLAMLVAFRPSSDWFDILMKLNPEIRRCKKRLKFKDRDNNSKDDNGAPFDSAVLIFRKDQIGNWWEN